MFAHSTDPHIQQSSIHGAERLKLAILVCLVRAGIKFRLPGVRLWPVARYRFSVCSTFGPWLIIRAPTLRVLQVYAHTGTIVLLLSCETKTAHNKSPMQQPTVHGLNMYMLRIAHIDVVGVFTGGCASEVGSGGDISARGSRPFLMPQ